MRALMSLPLVLVLSLLAVPAGATRLQTRIAEAVKEALEDSTPDELEAHETPVTSPVRRDSTPDELEAHETPVTSPVRSVSHVNQMESMDNVVDGEHLGSATRLHQDLNEVGSRESLHQDLGEAGYEPSIIDDRDGFLEDEDPIGDEDEIMAGPNTVDATKKDFVTPDFDDLSRVRLGQLTRAHVLKQTASEVVKTFAKDSYGITKSDWHDNFLESRIKAFQALGGSLSKPTIDFAQFTALSTEIELTAPGVVDGTFPDTISKKDIAKWLNMKPRGYWLSSMFTYGATRLAKSFIKVNKCPSLDDCATWTKFLQFIQLDTGKDAHLTFPQIAHHLPTDRTSSVLEWDKIAVVEAVDFAKIKFPSTLTLSILRTASKEKDIDLEEWNEHKLQQVITEFVKRDKRPSYKGKKEGFSGDLRFHQIADILPGAPALDDHNNFTHPIRGSDTKIHVPTLEEMSGKKKTMEITLPEIEEWLLKAEQGMTNQWLFGTDRLNYAKSMAKDILRWGDGSVPDVERPGEQNFKLQGIAAKEDDQFTDVAPRVAVFLHLDRDHVGSIDFQSAYPYIKAFITPVELD